MEKSNKYFLIKKWDGVFLFRVNGETGKSCPFMIWYQWKSHYKLSIFIWKLKFEMEKR